MPQTLPLRNNHHMDWIHEGSSTIRSMFRLSVSLYLISVIIFNLMMSGISLHAILFVCVFAVTKYIYIHLCCCKCIHKR